MIGDLCNPTAAITVADKIFYIENPIDTLKICFDIFCGLNISYPIEANHIWIFIERRVFNLNITKIALPNIDLLIKSLE